MITAKDGDTRDDPDDAYEHALIRVSTLHRQLHLATVRQDQAERERLTAEHAAAVDAVYVLRARETKQWARGFRFYRTDHESQFLFHIREVLDEALQAMEARIERRLAEVLRRLDEVEDVAAESALALKSEGVPAWE